MPLNRRRLTPGGATTMAAILALALVALSNGETLYHCKYDVGHLLGIHPHTHGSPAASIRPTGATSGVYCAVKCASAEPGCVAFSYESDDDVIEGSDVGCVLVFSDNPVDDQLLTETPSHQQFSLCYSSCIKTCFTCLYRSATAVKKSLCLASIPSCECDDIFEGNSNTGATELALISEPMPSGSSMTPTPPAPTMVAAAETTNTTAVPNPTPTTTPTTTTPTTTTPTTTTPTTTTPTTTSAFSTTTSTAATTSSTSTSTTTSTTSATTTSGASDDTTTTKLEPLGFPTKICTDKPPYAYYIYKRLATLNQSIDLCRSNGQEVFQPSDQNAADAMLKCAYNYTIPTHGLNATFLTGLLKPNATRAVFYFTNGTMMKSGPRMGNGQNVGLATCMVLIFRNLSPLSLAYECALKDSMHYFACQES